MYEIALSVAACLRSNTRADVAWQISTDLPKYQAVPGSVLLTAGGGRIGNLMDGIFQGQLTDLAGRQLPFATRQRLLVGPAEALMSGLSTGSSADVVLSPAALIPLEAWEAFLEKSPVLLRGRISNGVISAFEAYTSATLADAPADLAEVFQRGQNISIVSDTEIVSMFAPTTKLVIAGSGPIAEALRDHAVQLGWDVAVDAAPANVAGLTATLSSMDCVVVMGHDVESSSRNLEAALRSQAGYIGALGSRKMQQSRADWLAFRDVTDLTRVHGPAGLDIGATTPHEIAVSVLAQAIAAKAGKL